MPLSDLILMVRIVVITKFSIGLSGWNLLSGAKPDHACMHTLFIMCFSAQSFRAVKLRNLRLLFLRIDLSLDVSIQEGLVQNVSGVEVGCIS